LDRNLKATRLYSLKQYENLSLTNEINNIPEELVADHELISNLNRLQLLEIEMQYHYYCLLNDKKRQAGSLEEVTNILEEEHHKVIEELFDNKNFNEYLNKLINK
jgi:hypothetical protein